METGAWLLEDMERFSGAGGRSGGEPGKVKVIEREENERGTWNPLRRGHASV